MADSSRSSAELVSGMKNDLARWRDALGAVEPGGGFDQQKSMLSAWIKEGQRLLDRIEGDDLGS